RQEGRGIDSAEPDEVLLLGGFNFEGVSLAGLDERAFGCPKPRELIAHVRQGHAETGRSEVQQRKLLRFHVGPHFFEHVTQRGKLQKKNLIQPVGGTTTTVKQEGEAFGPGGPGLKRSVDAARKCSW